MTLRISPLGEAKAWLTTCALKSMDCQNHLRVFSYGCTNYCAYIYIYTDNITKFCAWGIFVCINISTKTHTHTWIYIYILDYIIGFLYYIGLYRIIYMRDYARVYVCVTVWNSEATCKTMCLILPSLIHFGASYIFKHGICCVCCACHWWWDPREVSIIQPYRSIPKI